MDCYDSIHRHIMNMEPGQKVVRIAPINFTPHEETAIREMISSSGEESKRKYSYSIAASKSARDAEILIAKMEAGDYDRAGQLFKRVYGVKSTIFVSDSPDPKTINGYKYVIKRNELDSTLLTMLDRVSSDELHFETKPAAPAAAKIQPSTESDLPAGSITIHHYGRVLIVDDSPSVRTQLNLYLSKRKFECYTAHDSEEAIRAVKQVQFDLIFLDVIMPGVDGYQACKVIKSLAGSKQVPVILLTSKNSPLDRIHGIMSGCDKYLTKPVRSSELEELLGSFFPKYVSKKAKDI